MQINCYDKHYVVLRMQYTGVSTMGKVTLRTGAGLPYLSSLDHSRSSWSPRGDVAVYSSSSGDTTKQYATDNDIFTSWTSDTNDGEWLVFDLGGHYPISRLEIDLGGDS